MTRTAWLAMRLALVGLGACQAFAETQRFEDEVRRLESAARERQPPDGAVMLYGSSSFRLWTNAAAAFPGVHIVNHGFGGSHLSDLNEYLERLVVPHAPRLLLIYGGDNDIAAGKSSERVLEDFERLVTAVRTRLPQTRIGFVAIKPSPSREKYRSEQRRANALVRRFARGHRGVDFLDIVPGLLDGNGLADPTCFVADRLHLNAKGYERWLAVLVPYVNRWE